MLVKKLPYPIAGLMLALASTGNLLASYGDHFRYFFGILAAVIFVLIVSKVILYPKSVAEGFSNPVIASVMPTFSMGIMILSTYLVAFWPGFSLYFWFAGVLLHLSFIVIFSIKYIFQFSFKAVFPSYFVVFVGIVVASVTAPAFDQVILGQYIFWFGFTFYLVLLPVIFYRYIKLPNMPEPALPTLNIFAAPASLLLAGYLNSFSDKHAFMVYFLLSLALVMLAFAFNKLPKLLKLPFYPSYSAFTFPFVISAIALKEVNNYFISTGNGLRFLVYLVNLMEFWSAAIVLYVLARYVSYLSVKPTPTSTKPPIAQ